MSVADSAWPRRLVVCCDGTWQSSVGGSENVPSNVTKLCRLVKRLGNDPDPTKQRKWHQIVYYDGGIGTGALSTFDKTKQGASGAGLAENVIEAYNFIVLNYQPGDEIFCFGFSRGAYTARAVAGLVTDIGVIETRHMQFFPEIYRRYKKNPIGERFILDEQTFEFAPEGIIAIPGSKKVQVVGVWDTVGSLGIPDVGIVNNFWSRSQYAFHNVSLNENIKHAFHALALDEHRKAFRPTLWYISNELKDKKKAAGEDLPELKQVWFPGVHINCGGGSSDSIEQMEGDKEQLANVTFVWMLQCIAPYLTIDEPEFRKTMGQYKLWLDKVQKGCTYWHKGFWGKAGEWIPSIPVVNPAPGELDEPKRDKPHAHPDLDRRWGTGPIVDSYTAQYWANGSEPRVPGHIKNEFYIKAEKKWTEPESYELHGDTNEYIHPVCQYRKMIRDDPKSALGIFKRVHVPDSGKEGRWWWTHEKHALPEWVILPQNDPGYNFERAWYDMCEKENKEPGDWLKNLDKENNFDIREKDQASFYPAMPKPLEDALANWKPESHGWFSSWFGGKH